MTSRLSAILMVAVLVGHISCQEDAGCLPSDCNYLGAATRDPGTANVRSYFAIGGFFDVHEAGDNLYQCGSAYNKVGLLNLQAFLWGIERYHSQSSMAANGIQVGAIAFDTCDRASESIENLLSFSKCKFHIQGIDRGNVVAYVGPYDNDAVFNVGHLATDLGITVVSPTADAIDLDGPDLRTLLKLAPSFDYDLKVIAHILKTLVRADYVMILHDNTDHVWHQAYMRLKELLDDPSSSHKICVSYDQTFSGTVTPELLVDLRERRSAKFIVPLMSPDHLQTLIRAIAADTSIPAGSFRFIVTSDVGQDPAYFAVSSYTTNNTLIVESVPSDSGSYQNDFDDFARYINELEIGRDTAPVASNNWIEDYVQTSTGDARLPDLLDDVTSSKTKMSVMRTLQSVSIIIQGMENAVRACVSQFFCDEYRNLFNKENVLYRQIKGVDLFGNSSSLAEGNVQYRVHHYFINNVNGDFDFQTVAQYSAQGDSFAVLEDLRNANAYGTLFSETSCSSAGECCEVVEPPTTTTTPAPTTTPDGQTQAPPPRPKHVDVPYPFGQDITGAFMDADRDGDDGTRFDNDHMWVIALGVLAGLGILCVVVFEIYILYKLLGTRLAHTWRTMWLGQLLLFGILLCYLTLIAFIFIPTKETCGITRFGVGVSYAFCFAVLLVKLMVILTSKSSDVLLPGEESPNYLKGIYQFLMFVFAVGVQVVIDVQWLITVPPEAIPVTNNIGETVWICNHYTWEAKGNGRDDMINMPDFVRTNFENHVLSLIYIMVLILITTVLSLNAHGIITNHRESVFIGIAAGFSIPIWLAWGLVGGLNDDHDYAEEFGDACIAFGLLITASLILFAMFLPKVRQLVNMGVEGIYLEDDRDTYYGGSVIMAPPSYKSKGPNSVIYVNNQGIYSEPVVIGNGDPSKDGNVATHLRHPGSTYSAPPNFMKKPDSTYGGSRVLRVTDDLKGRHPQKRPQSEVNYGSRPRSTRGTLPRSRSQTNLGAL